MALGEERLPRSYFQFWTSATVSALGDGIRVAAIPLLAASATREPSEIAVVTAAGFLPWPLLGLLGGAISDRFERRQLMWIVNGSRALVVALAALTVLHMGTIPIPLLASLAFVLGAAETVYDNAAIGFLARLVPTDLLSHANSRLYTSQLSATQLIGPPLGGLLFTVGAALPFALDSASFAISSVLILLVPHTPAGPPRREKNLRRDIIEGLVWLWKSPTLRAMAAITTALGAVTGALLAMLVIYAREELHLTSTGYGLLLGAFAIGSIAGALAAPRIMRARPLREVLTGTVVATAGIFAALASTSNAITASALLAALGVVVSTWNVASVTTRQQLVPNALLGRVSSAYRASALTFTTIGALASGILTGETSVATTLWACSGVALLGLAIGIRGLLQMATTPSR